MAEVYLWISRTCQVCHLDSSATTQNSQSSTRASRSLDVDDDLGLELLHALVIDQLLTTEGPSHWVDADGATRTTTLRELAPH